MKTLNIEAVDSLLKKKGVEVSFTGPMIFCESAIFQAHIDLSGSIENQMRNAGHLQCKYFICSIFSLTTPFAPQEYADSFLSVQMINLQVVPFSNIASSL